MSFFDLVASWQFWLLAAITYPLGLLLWPIAFPVILSYPWKNSENQQEDTAILAGSFNPPHYGHYAMLKYLSQRHAKVICVVGCNPNKKYAVTPGQRASLLRTMFSDLPNVEVRVVTTYIWRYGKKRQCRLFYRGIRTWDKDGKDERSLQILNTWGPLILGPTWPIPTHYLEGNPEFNHISSTLIRNLLSSGEGDDSKSVVRAELVKLVPESIVDQIMKLYTPKTEEQ